MVPLFVWLFLRFRYISTQKKLWREIINNKSTYGKKLASTLLETKIISEEFLDTEDAEKIINAMAAFPPVEEVKATILFLRKYQTLVNDNPEILEDKSFVRREIALPLMRHFLFFLAIMDEEIRKIIEAQVKEAEREGRNIDFIVPPLLKAAVDLANTWE